MDSRNSLGSLKPHQRVVIEIVWGDGKHEVVSEVIATRAEENQALLRPVVYNGMEIKLAVNEFKDMIFNLYFHDEDGKRHVINHVDVVSQAYKGDLYYCVATKSFKGVARGAERRRHPRMRINIHGEVKKEKGDLVCPITILDVSNNGISFEVDGEIDLSTSDRIICNWTDTIDDREFVVKVPAVVRRIGDKAIKKVYGCEIHNQPRNLVMYVLVKRSTQSDPVVISHT